MHVAFSGHTLPPAATLPPSLPPCLSVCLSVCGIAHTRGAGVCCSWVSAGSETGVLGRRTPAASTPPHTQTDRSITQSDNPRPSSPSVVLCSSSSAEHRT